MKPAHQTPSARSARSLRLALGAALLLPLALASCGGAARESLADLRASLDQAFAGGGPATSDAAVEEAFLTLLDDPVGRGHVEELDAAHDAIAYSELTRELLYLHRHEGVDKVCVGYAALRDGGGLARGHQRGPSAWTPEALAVDGEGLRVDFTVAGELRLGETERSAGSYRTTLDAVAHPLDLEVLLREAVVR
ncbi:MAG: hypothetical protein AAF682_05005 [Planctomycetota bacterium]